MTPFALRLCFRDPAREAPDYGGERCTFVVEGARLEEALTRWLDRADEKGIALHIVEEAGPVAGNDLAELVAAARQGGIAAGQSYGYAPLEPAKGVFFGLITDAEGWTELGVNAPDAASAVRAALRHADEERRAFATLEGFCDLTQASDEASFQGQPLAVAALGLGMQAPGTVQFGASYAMEEGDG